MKTKRLSLLLSCLLIISMLLCLAACGGGEETPCTHESVGDDGKCTECGEQVNDPTPPPADGDVVLVKDGAAKFNFIVGVTNADAVMKINNFIAKVNELLETDAETVADIAGTEGEIEIIFGPVKSRGDAFKVDEHYLGPKGYEIKMVGTKIVIYAGANDKYEDAVKWLEKEVFGITKSTKSITDLTVTAESVAKLVESDTIIDSVTIGNKNLDDFVIIVNDSKKVQAGGDKEKTMAKLAAAAQNAFYNNVGAWCEIVSESRRDETKPAIILNVINNDGVSDGYEATVTESGDFVFNCMFPDKFYDLAYDVLINDIAGSSKKTVKIKTGVYETKELRNIYYEDFGAIGNGERDDFEAIRACHEYANEWGHVVNAKSDATYYISSFTGGKSVTVMTDTYWHGCSFIFDDSEFEVHKSCQNSRTCDHCLSRGASIFNLESEYSGKSVVDVFQNHISNFGPLLSRFSGGAQTTKIEGWSFEYDVLVCITTKDRKVFIREGANSDGGDHQSEILLIHPDGTIDESTPLSWDYNSVTWADAYRVDDEEITLDGGLYDENGEITRWASVLTKSTRPEDNAYIATARNIYVTRSNCTVKNIDHSMTDDWEFRTPYAGFLNVRSCNNITFENIMLQNHKSRYEVKNGQNVVAGTYEIGGYRSNDLKYINVLTRNFFCDGADDDLTSNGAKHEAGDIAYRGAMGTNYCRNFYFNGCVLTSFDAHKGLGNLTIENSTFEHINLVGSGVASIKDSVVYADGNHSIFNLRADYGGYWRGDVIIENVEMKYTKDPMNSNSSKRLVLITAPYTDFDFDSDYSHRDAATGKDVYVEGEGSTNYLCVNVKVKGLKLTKYRVMSYIPDNGNGMNDIIEEELKADADVYLFTYNIYTAYSNTDISEFKDDGGYSNSNRYIGPETLVIEDCEVDIQVPYTAQFKNMVYTKDGVTVPYPPEDE